MNGVLVLALFESSCVVIELVESCVNDASIPLMDEFWVCSSPMLSIMFVLVADN